MSNLSSSVDLFSELFDGRTDAYGTWDGGSVKASVTSDMFASHLNGDFYFGVYPLLDTPLSSGVVRILMLMILMRHVIFRQLSF